MSFTHIVVVGNGIAGLTAAETLRSEGYTGDLTIVGEEIHAPYSRPALSKAALTEEGDVTSHLLAAPEHAAQELLGVGAVGLDVDASLLHLENGEALSFDGLIIASGIRPRKLREDLDLEVTIRTIEDSLWLRDQLAHAPKVTVVGAGVLGMEIASACAKAGCDVTVVSRRKPMLAFFGEYLADVFIEAAKAQGVAFVSPHAVDIREANGKREVILDDGSIIESEIVISAIGDAPNSEWLANSGLLTDGEVRVDSRGRLRANIVAAGDVAAIPARHPGVASHKRIPLWTSAIEQAKVAARALLHGDDADELSFQQYFWTDQFGLSLKACGDFPVDGAPGYVEGVPGKEPSLMRWQNADGSGTAVALNYRMPIPKLRALSREAPVTA